MILSHCAAQPHDDKCTECIYAETAHPLDFCRRSLPADAVQLEDPQAIFELLDREPLEGDGDGLRVGKFPFTASGKAVASAHTAGFAKLLSEPEAGEI